MKHIHEHLHTQTKIASFEEDIAIWLTYNDIGKSAFILKQSLKTILNWLQVLKLKIIPQEMFFTIFATDRKKRTIKVVNIDEWCVPGINSKTKLFKSNCRSRTMFSWTHQRKQGTKIYLKSLNVYVGYTKGAKPKFLTTT